MKRAESFEFVKRWQELEKERKSWDWKFTAFAADLRAACGDEDTFIKWLEIELDVTGQRAQEMVMRANAHAVVKDEATYKRLGGTKEISHVIGLPRKEQVTVIEAAKAQGKKIHVAIAERRRANELPSIDKIAVPPQRPNYLRQLEIVCQHLALFDDELPPALQAIVDEHAPRRRTKAA